MNPKPAPRATRLLEIAKIRTDGGTQIRTSIDPVVVHEYRELMEVGVEFPPIRVWFDGETYWLVDGFHRIAAAECVGAPQIAAEVLRGSLDDARWDSYAANSTHGLRRTTADIEAAIRRALEHPKSCQLSNYQIASHLHIPEASLRRWRKKLSTAPNLNEIRIAVRKGRSYSIKTSKIGNRQTTSHIAQASHQQLAQDLERAKAAASSDVKRVLNVIEKWMRHQSDGTTFLTAMDGVVRSFRRSSEKRLTKGLTIWFTGLSSAGKSTIAEGVYKRLTSTQSAVEWLDGDEMRRHLSKGLGFTKEDRDENVRRIGFVSQLLTRNGVIVLVSAIAPYREVRDELRSRIGDFLEVFVHAPIDVCEQRDLKGVYRRARVGEISGVTGIDDPYEPPLAPEVTCATDRETPTESVARVLTAIQEWERKATDQSLTYNKALDGPLTSR